MENENTPVETVETPVVPGKTTPVVPESTVTNSPDNGQGENGSGSETPPTPSVDEQLAEFYAKKGWDPEKGTEQLFKSYTELEGKLGNWKETERNATLYGELLNQSKEWYQKAQMWEEAQKREGIFKNLDGVKNGEVDLKSLPTEQLAFLWKEGHIGLNQLPPQRQYEVQKFTSQADAEFDRNIKTQANTLIEKYPVLKNPKVANLVADQIEKGVDPDKAVSAIMGLVSEFQKKGEETVKKDIEMLKNGNLERTSSAAPTKSSFKAKSVRDAFIAAKEEASRT